MASGSGSPAVRRREPQAAAGAAAVPAGQQPQQWTTAMETLLIDLVESRSYLWDRRHRGYVARGKRSRTFKDIGKVMRARWPDEDEQLFTFENIVHKFSHMKRRYRREWIVAENIRRRENRPDYEPSWEHYTKLSFLERSIMRDSMDSAIDIVTPNDMSDSSHDSDDAPSDPDEPPGDWRLGSGSQTLGTSLPRYPIYESSSSESGDEISAKFDPLPECYKNTKWWPKSPETARKKMYLKLAFSRYLNTVLSPVPDFLQKELARIKIARAIAKVNLPYA